VDPLGLHPPLYQFKNLIFFYAKQGILLGEYWMEEAEKKNKKFRKNSKQSMKFYHAIFKQLIRGAVRIQVMLTKVLSFEYFLMCLINLNIYFEKWVQKNCTVKSLH
jgi:hypothetical protein